MASLNVGNLGEYLREQRRNAQLSLRQLADAAGVSNPYLSQIERGLRKPSAEVLQQVAKALRISAETLYVRAGILDAERDRDEVETRAVLLADPSLNERQKQVLLQIYDSFRRENGFESGPGDGAQDPARGISGGQGTAPTSPEDRRGPEGAAAEGADTEDTTAEDHDTADGDDAVGLPHDQRSAG
ncbi:helix-turn-helix domain-containing protein [Streptomyces cavernae]|uniref:helix-turn-helix domain-containing protein n=1 Tax=Streptomyces cavernae TaxID=2259034 RepID=UPI001EE3C26B|nr:helix-turn-helix transcriptional regulator [Streptomyces cavernae]